MPFTINMQPRYQDALGLVADPCPEYIPVPLMMQQGVMANRFIGQ